MCAIRKDVRIMALFLNLDSNKDRHAVFVKDYY